MKDIPRASQEAAAFVARRQIPAVRRGAKAGFAILGTETTGTQAGFRPLPRAEAGTVATHRPGIPGPERRRVTEIVPVTASDAGREPGPTRRGEVSATTDHENTDVPNSGDQGQRSADGAWQATPAPDAPGGRGPRPPENETAQGGPEEDPVAVYRASLADEVELIGIDSPMFQGIEDGIRMQRHELALSKARQRGDARAIEAANRKIFDFSEEMRERTRGYGEEDAFEYNTHGARGTLWQVMVLGDLYADKYPEEDSLRHRERAIQALEAMVRDRKASESTD